MRYSKADLLVIGSGRVSCFSDFSVVQNLRDCKFPEDAATAIQRWYAFCYMYTTCFSIFNSLEQSQQACIDPQRNSNISTTKHAYAQPPNGTGAWFQIFKHFTNHFCLLAHQNKRFCIKSNPLHYYTPCMLVPENGHICVFRAVSKAPFFGSRT